VKSHSGGTAKTASGSGIHIKPSKVGTLHTALGVPQDKPIPAAKLNQALHSKSAAIRKKANFAKNAKKFKHTGPKKRTRGPTRPVEVHLHIHKGPSTDGGMGPM
jgi:hypothetical protein